MRHIVAVLVASLGACVVLVAQSDHQVPLQKTPVQSTSSATPAPQVPQESPIERERKDRELKIQERIATWTVVLAVVGGIVGLLTVWVTYLAATAAISGVKEARRAGQAAADALTISQRAERAYVTMSHLPPGLNVVTVSSPASLGGTRLSVRVKVQNSGNTPARVTSICLQVRLMLLPLEPDYDPKYTSLVSAFLVKNDYFIHEHHWSENEVLEGQVMSLVHPDPSLRPCVYGFVDYLDQFDVRHRSGYARMYEPEQDRHPPPEGADPDALERWQKRNNLIFVPQPGYNFDRVRLNGEGNDWTDASLAPTWQEMQAMLDEAISAAEHDEMKTNKLARRVSAFFKK